MKHARRLTLVFGLIAGILCLLGIAWLCFGPVYSASLVSCTGDSSGKMDCLTTTSWSGLIKWEGGSLMPLTLLYLGLLALAWTGVIAVSVLLSRFGTWRWQLALWAMIVLLPAFSLFGPPRSILFVAPGLVFALLASFTSLLSRRTTA